MWEQEHAEKHVSFNLSDLDEIAKINDKPSRNMFSFSSFRYASLSTGVLLGPWTVYPRIDIKDTEIYEYPHL